MLDGQISDLSGMAKIESCEVSELRERFILDDMIGFHIKHSKLSERSEMSSQYDAVAIDGELAEGGESTEYGSLNSGVPFEVETFQIGK